MIQRTILLTLLSCVVVCMEASAQTVDDLIKKNVEARGGLEKLRAIKTMRVTARIQSDGVSFPLIIQIKRPGLVRGDATVQGAMLVRAYDGENTWQINPFEGVKEPDKVSGYDAKEIIDLGDIDGPLVDYKAKGNTVELVGKEDMEATPVFKLKVTLKDGDVRYIYLDAGTFLELKETEKRKEDGAVNEVETSYSAYKSVAGVMFAYSSEDRINGAVDEQMTIEKIEVNVAIDDSIFKMPKKAPEKNP